MIIVCVVFDSGIWKLGMKTRNGKRKDYEYAVDWEVYRFSDEPI